MNSLKLVKEFLNMMKDRNLKEANKYLADDFEVTGAVPMPMNRYQFLSTWSGMFDAFPDWSFNVRSTEQRGNIVLVVFQSTGTHTNDLLIPGVHKVPATHVSIEQPRQKILFEVQGRKINNIDVVFVEGGGIAGVLEKIGLDTASLTNFRAEESLLENFMWFFREVMEKGNLDPVEQFVAPNVVMHDVYAPVQVIDRDSFKKNIRALITAFPDHQLVTEQAQLQGNTISMRWVAKGTNTGPFNDMEPTDRSFKITGASFYRLEGEKIIEGWVYMDSLSMMKQLGLVPEVDESIEEVDIYEEEIPAHH